MSRRRGMLACSVLLAGLLSGCAGAAPDEAGATGSGRAPSGSTATTTATAAPSATAGSSATAGASGDPVAAFALAKAGFSSARTSRYVVTTTYEYAGGEVLKMERTFTVDAPHGLLSADVAFQEDSKKGRDYVSLSFVQAGGRSYVRSQGATKWTRASTRDLATFAVPTPQKTVSAMPAAIGSFVPTTDIGKGEISGEVDARDYFELSGLTAIMGDPKALRDLRGTVDAHVQLQDGAVKSIRFLGQDHSFYLESDRDVPEEIETLTTYAEVEVRVTAIDHAVRIDDPRRTSSGTT
ncbi:MAG TPA: hypothetical protein VFL38_01085 [Humibacillus xanthopallidus]|nr:hypothetical protein [Humibacillus xanthopallidus]